MSASSTTDRPQGQELDPAARSKSPMTTRLPSVRLSVVTPTFVRPGLVEALLANIDAQTLAPDEMIVVDGSPPEDNRTERSPGLSANHPYVLHYVHATGGAALQRNVGIDLARGRFVAFIDDDVRLAPDFFERILSEFASDSVDSIGCIAGCLATPVRIKRRRLRWSIHHRLRILTTIRPGAFDFGSGHAIPRVVVDPGEALRRVDVVGGGCSVWRREVFDRGLRFSQFFRKYFDHEDFHLALVAGRSWEIHELGAARFEHIEEPAGRAAPRTRVAHRVINSRFVYVDIVPERTRKQEVRFWTLHAVDLLGRTFLAFVPMRGNGWAEVAGHASGMSARLPALAGPALDDLADRPERRDLTRAGRRRGRRRPPDRSPPPSPWLLRSHRHRLGVERLRQLRHHCQKPGAGWRRYANGPDRNIAGQPAVGHNGLG